MRPSDIFDICAELVEQLRTTETKVGAVRPDAGASRGTRRGGNVRAEYIADFELAGRAVLPKRRFRVFQAYYCAGLPYRAAIQHVGLRAGTFDYYCAEIKKQVGPELARRGLFPPRLYHERTKEENN